MICERHTKSQLTEVHVGVLLKILQDICKQSSPFTDHIKMV